MLATVVSTLRRTKKPVFCDHCPDNPLQLRANSRLEAAMCDDPEEQTIELTIEALTGTIYDLCVSPFETILGIKMRIQQFEGEYVSCWSGCVFCVACRLIG